MAGTLLLVDDDELILLSLGDLFSREGYEVRTAANGREALALAAETGFDVVVLDVVMPGMSGLDVCRALRAAEGYAAVPIVLLTAKSTPADEAKGLAAGATRFLPKPFDPKRLVEIVREL
ncbi:MAG: response regulator [Deltaproteobacteria bacterium]|nr:response regulator [Deltaproteobacteria bacterium]